MAREGDVDEFLRAELLRGVDHEVAARHEVDADGEVGDARYDARVFLRLSGEAEDVGPLLLYAAEGFRRSGDCVVNDYDLHLRVVGEADYLRYGRLHFRHEVVGHRNVLDHSAVGDVAVFLNHALGAAVGVLGLRDRQGRYANVEGGFRKRGRSHDERRGQSKDQCAGLSHLHISSSDK